MARLIVLLLLLLLATPARAQDALVTYKSLIPRWRSILRARRLPPAASAASRSRSRWWTASASRRCVLRDRFAGAHTVADRDRQGVDRRHLPHQHGRTCRHHASRACRRPGSARSPASSSSAAGWWWRRRLAGWRRRRLGRAGRRRGRCLRQGGNRGGAGQDRVLNASFARPAPASTDLRLTLR